MCSWCLLEFAFFGWRRLRRHFKPGIVCVIPELIEKTLPVILNHLEVNIHTTLKLQKQLLHEENYNKSSFRSF